MRKIKEILNDNNFVFNYKLGQNFITDLNLLNKIVTESDIKSNDTVVEIGTGAGTLTRALALFAKKVYTFEVDMNLKPVLDETLNGLDNVEVVYKDILKLTDSEILNIVGSDFKVVANIPYYITSPLIMRFLEGDLKPKTIMVMVQKEVADRLVAKKNTADYGAITMAVMLYGEAKKVGNISRNMFYPMPNVDSALVRIDTDDKYKNENLVLLHRLIKSAFAMRRKTFANNIVATFGFSKTEVEEILLDLGFDKRIRGETLDIDDLIKIANNEKFLKNLYK